MNVEVIVQQQDRKSLALKVTPGGVVAVIPRDLDPDSPRVRRFIETGLQRLRPPAPVSPSDRLTADELREAVADWSVRGGVPCEKMPRIRCP